MHPARRAARPGRGGAGGRGGRMELRARGSDPAGRPRVQYDSVNIRAGRGGG